MLLLSSFLLPLHFNYSIALDINHAIFLHSSHVLVLGLYDAIVLDINHAIVLGMSSLDIRLLIDLIELLHLIELL